MKKILKWTAIIFVGLFVIGLFLGEDETATTNTGAKIDEVEVEAEDGEEALPTDQVFKVGDVVDLNGLVVTIKDAKFVNPSEYSEPDKGKVLQMNIEVVNNRDDSVYVDNTDFNIYDMEGVAHEYYYGMDESDVSSDVNAGKKVLGTLTYDVPEGTNYELIYEPSFTWDNEQITFDIQPQ